MVTTCPLPEAGREFSAELNKNDFTWTDRAFAPPGRQVRIAPRQASNILGRTSTAGLDMIEVSEGS